MKCHGSSLRDLQCCMLSATPVQGRNQYLLLPGVLYAITGIPTEALDTSAGSNPTSVGEDRKYCNQAPSRKRYVTLYIIQAVSGGMVYFCDEWRMP